MSVFVLDYYASSSSGFYLLRDCFSSEIRTPMSNGCIDHDLI